MILVRILQQIFLGQNLTKEVVLLLPLFSAYNQYQLGLFLLGVQKVDLEWRLG